MSHRTVLGIDAAWTAHEPSGVALLAREGAGWRLVAAESSYDRFQARAEGSELLPPAGSKPCAADLLAACASLTGQAPALIAVDMPLSRNLEVEGGEEVQLCLIEMLQGRHPLRLQVRSSET